MSAIMVSLPQRKRAFGFRPLVTIVLTALILSIAGVAQSFTPTFPDNGLTPADPIGVPPQASATGDSERVNNVNGGLSVFIPVVSLPERGGWNLTLGYYHTSPSRSVQQDVEVSVVNQGGSAPALDYYTYNDYLRRYQNVLEINIPTLQASIEYTGDVKYTATFPSIQVATFCVTNWVFTDWSGSKHSFSNKSSCNVYGTGKNNPSLRSQITDSSDGSWLRLDTTTPSDVTVRTKDGTTYHFVYSDPYSSGYSPGYTNGGNNQEFAYFSQFSRMVDTNGNTITNNNGTLTDTMGRTVSASNSGITWIDANGVSRTASLTNASSSTAETYDLGTFSCVPGSADINGNITVYTGQSSFTAAPYTYTLTLPPADSTQPSRTFQLEFDGIDELTQITYPEGGYTKYDYQTEGWDHETDAVSCTQPVRQVAHKRECSNSAGCTSAQEAVTTYTPSPDYAMSNSEMDVIDPLGERNTFTITNYSTTAYGVAARETGHYVYDSAGTLVRSINTTYSPYVQGIDTQVPVQITTTLNNLSPVQTSVETLSYDTVSMTFLYQGTNWTNTVAIDNPTEIDEYDYAPSGQTGRWLKQTTKTWQKGGNYDIATGHILDRWASSTVTDPATSVLSTTSLGYDSVGNVMSKSLSGTGVSALTTTYLRNGYGEVTQMTDPGLHQTNFDYTDSWAQSSCAPPANSSAYLTSVTNALGQVTKYTYDSCVGLIGSVQDPNDLAAGRPGTVFQYDALGRQTSASYPDGGQTTHSYSDAIPNSVTATQLNSPNPSIINTSVLDGFGRRHSTQLTSDQQGPDIIDTIYDALGRVYSVTNPYRSTSDATYGITYHQYDPLDRETTLTRQDGNTVVTDYSAFPRVTVSDETQRKRQTVTDALGRLTDVYEPNPQTGLFDSAQFHTNYQYDALGNLTQATQYGDSSGPARVRTFHYDSLSRLLDSYNPETGWICYGTQNLSANPPCNRDGYDADGNLLYKTDARGVRISYGYDQLHRVTGKAYSDGTSGAAYSYDVGTNGVGYRTGMSDASGQTSWSYYPMGRVSGIQETVSGSLLPGGTAVTKNIGYTYWLNGSLKTITYPSGRVLNYQTDSAGRMSQVSKTDGPSQQEIRYAQVTSFTPQGAPGEIEIGNVLVNNVAIGCFNPMFVELSYSRRLQPLHILYTTTDPATARSEVQNTSCSTNSGDVLHRVYSFGDGFAGISGNNGNVAKITNCIDSNRSQNFSYDALSRINTAFTDGPNWGEQFTVDPWGNLTNITTTKGTAESLNAPVTASNRLSGWSYDSAGNQTSSSDPLGFAVTNSYDAEERLTSMTSMGGSAATYSYDADGNRVVKNLGGTGTLYWHGADGQVIGESDLAGTITSEYVFFNGERIARTDNPTDATKASLKYYLSDHLGSTSMITDATFSTVLEDEDYFPYGREVAGGGDDSNHYLFTGKERDSESNLDYFGARYYSSAMGRWLSPDWSATPDAVPYGKLDNPQSLNLYQYVLNNPLSQSDDDGHDIIYADGLKNAQLVKDTVQAILADPHTSGNLSGYVGPNSPNLTIQSGDLSSQDTVTRNPDGTTTTTVQGDTVPDIQTTSSTSTFNGVTTTSAPETTLTGATITIDNRTSKRDTTGVMVHESVHAGEAKANPAQFSKDAAAEKSLPHDQRPQEQRANAAQKSYTNEIRKAVKQIEKDRKKENQ